MQRRLTHELVKQITRQVFAYGNRRQLDALTKRIRREFDDDSNLASLDRLKTIIIARREMLEPPRRQAC